MTVDTASGNTLRYAKSGELYNRAQRVLAGGVSSEFRKTRQPHPLFYSGGKGSRIVDVDGNDYLDFSLSQGPLILGHSRAEVLNAVQLASEDGQLYAGQFEEELELALLVQQAIPCAELIRFGLDGSSMVQAALRLARAKTGRPRFLRFEGHYHGWLDNVAFGIGGPNPDAMGPREEPTPVRWTEGLPSRITDEALVLPWNDLALVERTLATHASEIAAIITEPVMCNSSCILPQPGFLQGLRELCDRHGIVLIFDEVITGFRLGLGGAQHYLGVTPDLAIFAKAIANGYPLSVLAGKRSVMQLITDSKVIHAGTLNGGVPSVAAGLATLRILEQENPYPRLFSLGSRLMEGLRAAAVNAGWSLLVQGPGPMFHAGFTERTSVSEFRHTFEYNTALGLEFVRELQDRNVRIIGRGLWYISAAHTEDDIDVALAAAADALHALRVRHPAG
jgi:glutamate-1-semialdehyde 2,1-aminomutase